MQAHPLSPRASLPTFSPPAAADGLAGIPDRLGPNGPGAAHDAGNLLSALHLYADLLAAPGVLRPEHAHYANELRTLAARSSAWLTRTRDQACADTPVCGFAHDGVQALRSLEPLLARLAAPHASFSLRVPKVLPWLPFAAEVLERLTLNLVRNAAQAIAAQPGREAPGVITASLTRRGGALSLTVEDDGPGLDLPAATRLLHGVPAAPGGGLGHRVVRELAQVTGAALEVRVRPGQATAVTLTWRLCAAAAPHRRSSGECRAC